jgi:hypothetical protein
LVRRAAAAALLLLTHAESVLLHGGLLGVGTRDCERGARRFYLPLQRVNARLSSPLKKSPLAR